MNNKVVDYGACEAATEKELEQMVEERRKDGWIPHGYSVKQENTYVQLLVKYNFINGN